VLVIAFLQAAASAATKVFLLAGQSNMAGVGGYTGYCKGVPLWGDPPGDQPDAPCPSNDAYQPDVNFWDYAPNVLGYVNFPLRTGYFVNNPGVGGSWVPLQTGFGYMTDQFGPELSFGARLHELMPNDDIYLVKLGVSSTNLAVDWNPSGTGGPEYDLFKARVVAAMQNLIASGKNPTIAGMIWMQGEDDAAGGDASAGAYAQNLTNLVTTVRSTFPNATNMKFVTGRITTAFGDATDNGLVRSAQENVSDLVGNASWVNTDDLEWAYYGHYGTQGQIDLGTRFADAFAVPEPSALVLACVGVLCLLGYLRQSQRMGGAMVPRDEE
jgi:hypothetical protein